MNSKIECKQEEQLMNYLVSSILLKIKDTRKLM